MKPPRRNDSLPAQSWNTPLNTLRALAILSFACFVIAMLFPTLQRYLVSGSIITCGVLIAHLFKIKAVEEKHDPREHDMTSLGLGNS